MSNETQPRQPSGAPTGGQFTGKTNPESDVDLEDQPNWGVCRSSVGDWSPWGAIDNVSHLAPGIDQVDTPSHGGIRLSKERNAVVDPAWRDPDGWYEEDCEWAVPAFTFPDAFPDTESEAVHRTLRNWFPNEYEKVTGAQIRPGESYIRDEQLFFADFDDYMIGVSAIQSDSHPGMVEVTALRGGRGPNSRGERKNYLVPEDVYKERTMHGYVVDHTNPNAPCFLDDRPDTAPKEWVGGVNYHLVIAGTGEKVLGTNARASGRFVMPGEMVTIANEFTGIEGPVRFLGVQENGNYLYVDATGQRGSIRYQSYQGIEPVEGTG